MPGQLLSVDEARSRVLAAVRPLGPERVGVDDALGRVLAEDVAAELDLPPFDSSAMDGFALVAGDAGELPVVGESQAGAPFDGRLQAGQAVRISTGAVIPAGADAVVPIERVEVLAADAGDRGAGDRGAGEGGGSAGGGGSGADGARIRVPGTSPGAHIRRAGEDLHRGDVVLRAGTEVGPAEVGMLAALGCADAQVARRPRLAIVATGDELVPAGQPLAPGQIHDSNATALGALARRAGADVIARHAAADDLAATVAAFAEALEGADVLCVSGGVSVGPHDHVKPALAQLGFEELLWGVSLKPGKPFWFGVRGEQYAFGLPGNPVSAMVTFVLFARPALRALQGSDPSATRTVARLDGPIPANEDRDQAVRCRLRVADDGWHAEPTGPQGSHVMSSMLGAGALAIVPAGERDLAPGELVSVELI
jgi:molybdopterin molybdotransferase